jgi:hypothetical protein
MSLCSQLAEPVAEACEARAVNMPDYQPPSDDDESVEPWFCEPDDFGGHADDQDDDMS